MQVTPLGIPHFTLPTSHFSLSLSLFLSYSFYRIFSLQQQLQQQLQIDTNQSCNLRVLKQFFALKTCTKRFVVLVERAARQQREGESTECVERGKSSGRSRAGTEVALRVNAFLWAAKLQAKSKINKWRNEFTERERWEKVACLVLPPHFTLYTASHSSLCPVLLSRFSSLHSSSLRQAAFGPVNCLIMQNSRVEKFYSFLYWI